MTPRDKELADHFIDLVNNANPQDYGKIWTATRRERVNVAGSFVDTEADYMLFQYREVTGLTYRQTPLALSWWRRCRVRYAARRLAELGDLIYQEAIEVERQKAIAQ